MSWSCPNCGLANDDRSHTCSYATVDYVCGGRQPDPAPARCSCGRRSTNPCDPCRLLAESDLFNYDAQHDKRSRDRDSYEVYMEREKAEER